MNERDYFYACTAGVQGGIARCRKEDGKCDNHHNGAAWPHAPEPDVVLVKMNLNQGRNAEFARAGVRQLTRSFERSEELSREHVARAEALDRKPFAVRQGRENDTTTPEAADSGCPVFGKTGLHSVTVRGLITELQLEGFVLSDAHRLFRFHKPPVRLVMEFVKKGAKPEITKFPWDLFNGLTETCFGQVDVWANDRSPKNGLVVHTVNCGQRDDKAQARYRLKFADGDWDADVIPLTLEVDLDA